MSLPLRKEETRCKNDFFIPSFPNTYVLMGGRQDTNELCVVTKTNAWKIVRCESVERRRGGGLSDHFLVEARLKLVGG